MKNCFIPDAHYKAILAQLRPDYRYLAVLLRLTGYRVDDLLSTRNYQWSGSCVELREKKTGKLRRVKIASAITAALNRYRRACAGGRDRHPLAYTFYARREADGTRHKMHRTTLYRQWETAVKRAGLAGMGYTIHSLRRCYAHDKYIETGSLLAVQRDLGHRYISTTMIYVMGDEIHL